MQLILAEITSQDFPLTCCIPTQLYCIISWSAKHSAVCFQGNDRRPVQTVATSSQPLIPPEIFLSRSSPHQEMSEHAPMSSSLAVCSHCGICVHQCEYICLLTEYIRTVSLAELTSWMGNYQVVGSRNTEWFQCDYLCGLVVIRWCALERAQPSRVTPSWTVLCSLPCWTEATIMLLEVEFSRTKSGLSLSWSTSQALPFCRETDDCNVLLCAAE